jgi:hypothetical protein
LLLSIGPAAIADAIKDMGALTVLNLADNSIKAKKSHKHALSHAIGLKHRICDECRQSCTEAYQCVKSGYDCCAACNNIECPVVALADAIKNMRALTQLTFGEKQVVTMTTEMTKADFSGKLKSYEAQMVAAFLPKCT